MYYIQECDKPKFWNKIFNVIELYEDKIILPINNVDGNIKKEPLQREAHKNDFFIRSASDIVFLSVRIGHCFHKSF